MGGYDHRWLADQWYFRCPQRIAIQLDEQLLLTELVLAMADRGPAALDPMFVRSYQDAAGDGPALRVVLDQVSLLTDAQAVSRHHRLTS